jgi:hypothetical protein
VLACNACTASATSGGTASTVLARVSATALRRA